MIKYIKRKNLDTKKYDDCIENALNSRVYAFSWYLDIVADNWDVLVLNDYEAVMPLPWRRKYLIKYVYPPCWTQQLGVFSSVKIDTELIKLFLNSIPKKFLKVTVQLNSGNALLSSSEVRFNYILPLSHSYRETVRGFNKNRKRELKKSEKHEDIFLDRKLSSSQFLSFLQNQKLPFDLSKDGREKLERLLDVRRKDILIFGALKEGVLLSAILLLKDKKRITYLLPVSSIEAKKEAIHTFLVAELIKEFSDSGYVLDFEGSMIPGVAKFYKSFGAKQELYYNLTFSRMII